MIATAIQRGNTVYVYNEKNSTLFTAFGELQGYTSSTVSIKKATTIYVYNEKGSIISTHFSR